MSRFQYQGVAEPILPLVGVTVAAWQPVLPPQPPRAPLFAPCSQEFGPVFVPPAVTVDQWLYPPQVAARWPRSYEGYAVEPIRPPLGASVADWLYPPQVPQAAARPAPRSAQFGPVTVPAPAVAPSFDWYQQQPDQIRRGARGVFWARMFTGPVLLVTLATGTEPVLLVRRAAGYSAERKLD